MSDIKKITGKIVNYNSSIIGNLNFNSEIQNIEEISSNEYDYIIIPGFIDLIASISPRQDRTVAFFKTSISASLLINLKPSIIGVMSFISDPCI